MMETWFHALFDMYIVMGLLFLSVAPFAVVYLIYKLWKGDL